MSLWGQLSNTTSYYMNKATYNPEAEEYAKEAAVAKAQADVAQARDAKDKDAKVAALKAAEKAKIAEAAEEERRTFSAWRITVKAFKYFMAAIFIVLIVLILLACTCHAVNLNIYRPWYQRLWYAIYAPAWAILTIPYMFIYRPYVAQYKYQSHGFLPLFEEAEASQFTKTYLPFMVFKRDDGITDTKEWEPATMTVPPLVEVTTPKTAV